MQAAARDPCSIHGVASIPQEGKMVKEHIYQLIVREKTHDGAFEGKDDEDYLRRHSCPR